MIGEADLVISVCIEKSKKFLLLRRGADQTRPGIWEFPSGRTRQGEKIKNTAIRLAREQTNIKLKAAEQVGMAESISGADHMVVLHFYSKTRGGAIRLSQQHTDYRWADRRQINAMRPGRDASEESLGFFDLRKR
ncbi:MAG: NUDIX hydrolase [Candidatus Aenigmarchaeota archaeon]|nr:NUDIX hydrolase [Candidatus Aenigmarchaeota archaeon]